MINVFKYLSLSICAAALCAIVVGVIGFSTIVIFCGSFAFVFGLMFYFFFKELEELKENIEEVESKIVPLKAEINNLKTDNASLTYRISLLEQQAKND